MRAPLRSMYGYAELVVKDYGPKLDSEGVQYLKQLLNISHVKTGCWLVEDV
mgnify:CR=1 FL=1